MIQGSYVVHHEAESTRGVLGSESPYSTLMQACLKGVK